MRKDLLYKEPLLVIYVPGYLSGEANQDEVVKQLEELYESDKNKYHDPTVITFTWDSVTSYSRALHNSIAAADELVEYLKSLPCGNRITLVGHSLGALVVYNAMRKIPFNAYYGAKQVILIGAAIDAHIDLRHMCEVTEYPVLNVINPNDVVLNSLYRTYNDSPALGSHGSYCKHRRNYVELEILPRVAKGMVSDALNEVANELLDIAGHSSSRVYLDSLLNGNFKIRK